MNDDRRDHYRSRSMSPPDRPPADLTEHEEIERQRVWREGTTMVLYVSIVLLGTLAVLPAGKSATGGIQGPTGLELAAIVWGTTIGLALAHWFAFHIATHGVAGGRLRGQDAKEAMAQLAGAALVAALVCVPIVLLEPKAEQRAVLFVLALVVGGADFSIERSKGHTRMRSAVYGLITLLVALVVAAVKLAFSGH